MFARSDFEVLADLMRGAAGKVIVSIDLDLRPGISSKNE